MIKILCESKFRRSAWCKQIVSGITSSLKKKRRKFDEISSIDEIVNNPCDGVYLVGTNDKWINDKVRICNDIDIVPIVVCNQRGRLCKGEYHCVTVDIEDAMKQICEYLHQSGCSKSVFYGLNPSSAADRGKAQCLCEQLGKDIPIIENNGSIEKSFSQLYGDIQCYDSIICANDFVAVLLVKKLLDLNKELLDTINIVSCAKVMLSTVFGEYIMSQETNYEELGKVSAEMYEFLIDKEYVSSLTLSIKCYGFEKNSNSSLQLSDNVSFSDDAFYEDAELVVAMKVDNLLSECKDDDLQILKMICNGKTYPLIAQLCFMSESNVKYHVKKYCELLNLKGREELKEMLTPYLIY